MHLDNGAAVQGHPLNKPSEPQTLLPPHAGRYEQNEEDVGSASLTKITLSFDVYCSCYGYALNKTLGHKVVQPAGFYLIPSEICLALLVCMWTTYMLSACKGQKRAPDALGIVQGGCELPCRCW